MRWPRRTGTRLSLALMWVVDAVRYALFPTQGEVRGVRIILLHERRVLLVSHWYAPWVWTLPGGGVKKNEIPEKAAMREAREETGLTVRSLAGRIGLYEGRWGKRDMIAVFYSGDIEGSLSLTPNIEIMSRSWFDIDHLPEELARAHGRRIEAYRAGIRNEKGVW